MAVEATIDKQEFLDVLHGKTNNPLAEQEIPRMARAGQLMITSEGKFYLFIDESFVEVIPASRMAALFEITPDESALLVSRISSKSISTWKRPFHSEEVFEVEEIHNSILAQAKLTGLTEQEAALELGITIDSFHRFSGNIEFECEGKYLKVFIEKARNRYLPNDKIWTTRTELLLEFIERYKVRTGTELSPAYCEIENCGHLASDQCSNPKCRPGEIQRIICPAHENWIESERPLSLRPKSICPECRGLVDAGKLNFTLM